MTETDSENFKIGISIWVSVCLFVCLWFITSFFRGRRQFQANLHVIEDGLRRMQDEIELRQRQNSIGCIENFDDILKDINPNYKQKKEESGKTEDEESGLASLLKQIRKDKEEKDNLKEEGKITENPNEKEQKKEEEERVEPDKKND